MESRASWVNPDPKAYFENHAVIAYNGNIYDPSYGTIEKPVVGNSECPSWIDHSIGGIGAVFSYEDQSGKVFLLLWLHKSSGLYDLIKFN